MATRRDILLAICMVFSLINMKRRQQMGMIAAMIASIHRDKIYKVRKFYEDTVPRMLPREFRRFFRMFPNTLDKLTNYIERSGSLQPMALTAIPIGKRVAMMTAYLGSQWPTLQLAHLFDVAEETFLRHTEIIMDALINDIDQFICWPHPNEFPFLAAQFDKIGRHFPNIIACIDGLHCEIEIHKEDRTSHRNYKQFYSLHLQGCCLYDLRFCDIFAGVPGRAHDAGVFRLSELSKNLDDLMRIPGRNLLESYNVLGDSAYPISKYLITPYKNYGALSRQQKKFNQHLSSKRQNIERAFGLLFRRFPRVRYLRQQTTLKKVKVIMASCILHNLCIMEKDNIFYYLKRVGKTVARHLRNEQDCFTHQNTLIGQYKRDLLTLWVDQH